MYVTKNTYFLCVQNRFVKDDNGSNLVVFFLIGVNYNNYRVKKKKDLDFVLGLGSRFKLARIWTRLQS